MTERIELPESAWAELRSPRSVPERLRRPVTKIMFQISQQQAQSLSVDVVDPEMVMVYSELNDLLIVARVVAWSYDLPITVDSVLDLPGDAYEILQAKAAESMTEMIPNFASSNDPESPTLPSDV
jgi:hypothetical protein